MKANDADYGFNNATPFNHFEPIPLSGGDSDKPDKSRAASGYFPRPILESNTEIKSKPYGKATSDSEATPISGGRGDRPVNRASQGYDQNNGQAAGGTDHSMPERSWMKTSPVGSGSGMEVPISGGASEDSSMPKKWTKRYGLAPAAEKRDGRES